MLILFVKHRRVKGGRTKQQDATRTRILTKGPECDRSRLHPRPSQMLHQSWGAAPRLKEILSYHKGGLFLLSFGGTVDPAILRGPRIKREIKTKGAGVVLGPAKKKMGCGGSLRGWGTFHDWEGPGGSSIWGARSSRGTEDDGDDARSKNLWRGSPGNLLGL